MASQVLLHLHFQISRFVAMPVACAALCLCFAKRLSIALLRMLLGLAG